jgi:dienelactone hydrolase
MVNTISGLDQPQFVITPESGLVDEKLDILVSGLQPEKRVTLQAKLDTVSGQSLSSYATFQAGADGRIDLSKQAPIAGSYDWADSMGLIWTMQPQIDPDKPRRPTVYGVGPMEITFDLEIEGKVAASKRIRRLWMKEGTQRIVLHEDGLRGIFFLPPGEGPFPGVILVTGSGGGLNENRAAQFASHGYAALALAHFAYEDLPKSLIEIPLEYFEKSINWLQHQPKVDGSQLAITGGSRGGELSLLLGATFPQFKAVAAYVPSSVSWGGVGIEGNPDKPAWTFRGKPVTYITHKPSEEVVIDDPNQPIPLTSAFLEAMEKKEELEAATIPVEKINGPVLLISGEDDQMWPSSLFARMAAERLKKKAFKFHYEHLSYPGAGHSIAAPYIPLTPSHGIHPVDHRDYAYGGNPKDQSFANADSWRRVIQLFDETLKKGS